MSRKRVCWKSDGVGVNGQGPWIDEKLAEQDLASSEAAHPDLVHWLEDEPKSMAAAVPIPKIFHHPV